MTRRYALSDASSELIKDLVSPEQNVAVLAVMNVRFSTQSCGSYAQALPGATCLNILCLGRRCISVCDWRYDGTFERVLEPLHI